jgi:hypothetical protein
VQFFGGDRGEVVDGLTQHLDLCVLAAEHAGDRVELGAHVFVMKPQPDLMKLTEAIRMLAEQLGAERQARAERLNRLRLLRWYVSLADADDPADTTSMRSRTSRSSATPPSPHITRRLARASATTNLAYRSRVLTTEMVSLTCGQARPQRGPYAGRVR